MDLPKLTQHLWNYALERPFFRANSFSKGVEFVDNDCNEKWELLQRILDFQEVWKSEKLKYLNQTNNGIRFSRISDVN